MLAVIGAGLSLVLLILQEYFSAKSIAREQDRKFELSQAELKKLVDSAVLKWNQNNATDSKKAGDAWDQADK